MSFGTIFTIAVGLSMDATAVAAARGLAAPRVSLRQASTVALLFGAAQAAMPLLGWFAGRLIGPLVSAWDHWIAFALLSAIGGKMLWEARRSAGREEAARAGDPFRLRVILALAIATSIDAFAVGITLPMLGAPLVLTLVTIGVTTAVLSGLAVLAGRRLSARFGRRLDALGGVVLIGLGLKILIEHLSAG
jgi:manganese efflux pump family protein